MKTTSKQYLCPKGISTVRCAAAAVRDTTKTLKQIKQLRGIGASDYEIAKALGVPEDSPLLHHG